MAEIDLDYNGIDLKSIDVNLKSLYYFSIVAETKSITKAASRLYVTQSTLSKNIILLEQNLGIQLLERKGKNISITPAGNFIYEKWKDLIKTYNDQIAAVRKFQEIVPDRIRIGFFPALDVVDYFDKFLGRIQQYQPEMFIEIFRMNNTRLFEHMNAEKIDLLFTLEKDIPLQKENYEWKIVDQVPLAVIYSNDHSLAKKEQIYPEDLNDQVIFFNNPGGALSRESWLISLLEKWNIYPKKLTFVNTDLTAAINAVGGLGIALGPACSFGKIPSRGKISNVESAFFEIAALWRKDERPGFKKLFYEILE